VVFSKFIEVRNAHLWDIKQSVMVNILLNFRDKLSVPSVRVKDRRRFIPEDGSDRLSESVG